jgi:hypothetical protein
MSKDDVERDLAQLRAEVAALSAVRKESAATSTASAPPSPAADATASTQTSAEPETGVAGAAEAAGPEHSQLDELLELLEAEIKDLPTITCLIVFSLGILMGRFLR